MSGRIRMIKTVGKSLVTVAMILLVARLVQFWAMGYFIIDLADAPPVCKYTFQGLTNLNALMYDLTGQAAVPPAPWALFLIAGMLLLIVAAIASEKER